MLCFFFILGLIRKRRVSGVVHFYQDGIVILGEDLHFGWFQCNFYWTCVLYYNLLYYYYHMWAEGTLQPDFPQCSALGFVNSRGPWTELRGTLPANDQAHNPALNLNLSALYSPHSSYYTKCNNVFKMKSFVSDRCVWVMIYRWGEGERRPVQTARRCDWWGVGPKVSTVRTCLVFQEVRRCSPTCFGGLRNAFIRTVCWSWLGLGE